MGVKTALAGITLTNTDSQDGFGANASGYAEDIAGNMKLAMLKCQEASILLTRVQAIMTAASDGGNATTVGTQITALS